MDYHRGADPVFDLVMNSSANSLTQHIKDLQKRLASSTEYAIKLQRLIEAACRCDDPLPSPELHHSRMLEKHSARLAEAERWIAQVRKDYVGASRYVDQQIRRQDEAARAADSASSEDAGR